MNRIHWSLLAFLPLLGCLEPTQVTFDITTDIPCDRANRTAITVGLAGETEGADPTKVVSDCMSDGTVGSIGTFAVVPGEKPRTAAIKVALAVGDSTNVDTDCTEAGGYKNCIVARRSVNFVAHHSLVVPIQLLLICKDVVCDSNSTCNLAGKCVSAVVDQSNCDGDRCNELVQDGGVPSDPTATALAFATQPSATSTAGEAFPVQPAVEFRNTAGERVTTASGSIELKAYGDNACTQELPGALAGTTSVAATGGQATFAGLAPLKTTVVRLGATSGTFKACSQALSITAGAAHHLVFSQQPSATGTAGTALAQQPVVQILDANDNLAAGSSASITVDGASDSACQAVIANSIAGTGNPLTATQGVAGFTGLKVQRSAVTHLRASGSGLTAACSSAITIAAGAPATATATAMPQTLSADGASLTTIEVVVTDAYSNVLPGVPVTLTSSRGVTDVIAPGATSTNADGVIQFRVKSSLAGMATFTPVFSGTTAVPVIVTFTSGPATKVGYLAQPSNMGDADTALAQQPRVQLLDAQNNAVTDTITNIAVAAFSDTTCATAVTNGVDPGFTFTQANGSAQLSGLTLRKTNVVAIGITVSTSAGALPQACSAPTSIFAGAIASLAFPTQPTSSWVAGATMGTFAVRTYDAWGNLVMTAQSISVTGHSNAGCTAPVANGATATPQTTSQGTATFSPFFVFKTSVVRLQASDGTHTVCSDPLTVLPGAADPLHSSLTISPTTGLADGVTPMVATLVVKDRYDNPLTGATVTTSGAVIPTGATVTGAMGTTDNTGTLAVSVVARTPLTVTIASVNVDAASLFTNLSFTFVAPPAYGFDRAGYVVREGGNTFLNGSSSITVQRTSGIVPGSVSVQWQAVTAADRFTPGTLTLNFAMGEVTKTIPLSTFGLNDDGVVNGDLFIGLRLSDVTGGILGTQSNAKLWLVDSELADGDFMFDSTLYTVSSGQPSPIHVVRALGDTSAAATVDVAFIDGSARAGTEYTGTTQTVSFAIGEAEKTVTIPVPSTPAADGRSFFMALRSAQSHKLRNVSLAKVRILGTDSKARGCDWTNSSLSTFNGFGGGTGTSTDPFQICSLFQLGRLKAHAVSSGATTYYRLMGDIDADPSLDSDAVTAGVQPFTEMGAPPLSLLGNEHIIWNFREQVTGGGNHGFFSVGALVSAQTSVSGLNLEHEFIRGSGGTGNIGLLEGSTNPSGFASPLVRQYNYTSGAIFAPLGDNLGGLIGLANVTSGTSANQGNFSNCRIRGGSKLGGLHGFADHEDASGVPHRNEFAISVLEPTGDYAGGYTGRSDYSRERLIDSQFNSLILGSGTSNSLGGYAGASDVKPFFQGTELTNTRTLTHILGGQSKLGGLYGELTCVKDTLSSPCDAVLTNPTVDVTVGSAGTPVFLGGLIGRAQSQGTMIITTATVSGDIGQQTTNNGSADAWGGLIGSYDADPMTMGQTSRLSVVSARVAVNLRSDKAPSIGTIGGLIGNFSTDDKLQSNFDDNTFTGTIAATGLTGSAGGFFGAMSLAGADTVTLLRSVASIGTSRSTGNLTISNATMGSSAGGLVGSVTGAGTGASPSDFEVFGVYAKGNVNAQTSVSTTSGGMFGQATLGSTTMVVTDSAATGNVTGKAPDSTGGFVGKVTTSTGNASATFARTFASGNVSVPPDFTNPVGYVGGWAGTLYAERGSISVQKSYASGTVQGGTGNALASTAGFAGIAYFDIALLTITDCYTSSPVSTQGGMGQSGAGFTTSPSMTSSPSLTNVHAYQAALTLGDKGLVRGISSVSNSWFCDVSGGGTDAANISQSAAWFTNASNFTAWNFTSTWEIVNGLYPTLRNMPSGL